MTLGRTSSGAIKTKSDGGLRAVNCACCGCSDVGCDCACVSANLRKIIESANNVNVNGVDIPWDGISAFYEGPAPNSTGYLLTSVSYAQGVICAVAFDRINTVKFVPEPFAATDCFEFGDSVIMDVSFINNEYYRAAQQFATFFPQINPDLVLYFS